jgi:tetratricopeptide (TPR) repeat protein
MDIPLNVTELIQRGNDAFDREDLQGALSYYKQALNGVRGDPDQLADLYGNIGNAHGALGQADLALRFYEQSIAILKEQEDYARLGITFANMGNLSVDRGDSDRAIHFYKQAELLLEREGREDILATLYSNYSLALLLRAENDAALAYAEKGLTLAQKFNRPRTRALATHRLAKAKGACGLLPEARACSETAYVLYAQLNDEMGMAAAIYHQARLYEQMGDLESAIRCMEQVVAIDQKHALPKLSENRQRLAQLRDTLPHR